MFGPFLKSDVPRRVLLTVGILLVYRLGCQIPLPGLDQNTLRHLGASQIVHERISIFALGVTPIFSVLMLVEIAKLVPALGRWGSAEPSHAARLNRYTNIAALIVAAFYAFRWANALESVSGLVEERGWMFHWTVAATFVAATALLGWLGVMITSYGIGNGFWLVLLTPTLAGLPDTIWQCFILWEQGVDSAALIVAIGFIIFATALVVAVGQARYDRSGASDQSSGITRSQVRGHGSDLAIALPPLLADYIGAPFRALGITVHALIVASLIAAFTYSRSRSGFNDRPGDIGAMSERSTAERASRLAWIIATAHIVVCIGGELMTLNLHLPFSIQGSWLILVVTVATSYLAAIGIEARALRGSVAQVGR
jgi:preprotein translocase subunit SecY